MKNIFFALFTILVISCSSTKFDEDLLIISTTERKVVTKDLSFKIEKILSDSRCPEGVQCVWAGEVHLLLGVYENNSKTEKIELKINHQNFTENKSFFETKIPLENKKIETIQILPNKVEGIQIEEKEYQLKLFFSENQN